MKLTLEQLLSKARYKYEIADYLKISRRCLNDYVKFYDLDWKNKRLIPPFEIKRLFIKLDEMS